MNRFLLQCEASGHMWELPHTAREVMDALNEWNAGAPGYDQKRDGLTYIMASHEDVLRGGCEVLGVIPVGSVEYVNMVLSRLGRPPLCAVNVPQELRDLSFTGRRVYDAATQDDVSHILSCPEAPTSLLVKPGDTPKRFEAQKVTRSDITRLRECPGPYFVSEILDKEIDAEWRVFFHHGRIISARPYLLPTWVCPDRAFAERLLKAWPTAPAAGTLDIAVLEDGTNILLEAHQFISCGLYGFDDPELIPMLRDGWNWELNRKP